MEAGTEQQTRLRALFSAGIALSSELSLDAVLQKLIQTAAELTGARYAAMGVIDRSGHELERFLTHGIDPETQAEIGPLPRGRGILGVLIRDATPLRLHDIKDDPRSVGFPPNHPPMKSFLGVPVVLRGVAYGNLYLTDKRGSEDFTHEDEELVTLLASQAAVAIENARLYESATRWLRQLESLNEVGNALLGEIELSRMLGLIAERLRELIRAQAVIIARPAGGGTLRIDAADGERVGDVLGSTIPADGSKSGRILERRRSERVDSLIDDPEVDQDIARRIGAHSALFVPLVLRDKAIGVMSAFDKIGRDVRFLDDDMRVAEAFAARAAAAIDVSERVARDALRRVVAGQELERRRLARELHDETGQALTSIILGLRSVEEAGSLEEARAAGTAARELVVATLQDVRRLALELRPTVLDDFGLVAALERLTQSFAEQTGINVELEAPLGEGRLPQEVETALYRIVQEALTNVVKHAQAGNVSIVVARREGIVTAVVEDDGIGIAEGADGGGLGLIGMRERLALLDGRLAIESGSAGTTLAAEVPLR